MESDADHIIHTLGVRHEEWAIHRETARDMLDSKKTTCQSTRVGQLQSLKLEYQPRFKEESKIFSFQTGLTMDSDLAVNRGRRILDYTTRNLVWHTQNGTAHSDAVLKYRRQFQGEKRLRPRLKVGILLGVANAKSMMEKYQPSERCHQYQVPWHFGSGAECSTTYSYFHILPPLSPHCQSETGFASHYHQPLAVLRVAPSDRISDANGRHEFTCAFPIR